MGVETAIITGLAVSAGLSTAAAANSVITGRNNQRRAKNAAKSQRAEIERQKATELERRKAGIDQQREQMSAGTGSSPISGASSAGIKATIPDREVLG